MNVDSERLRGIARQTVKVAVPALAAWEVAHGSPVSAQTPTPTPNCEVQVNIDARVAGTPIPNKSYLIEVNGTAFPVNTNADGRAQQRLPRYQSDATDAQGRPAKNINLVPDDGRQVSTYAAACGLNYNLPDNLTEPQATAVAQLRATRMAVATAVPANATLGLGALPTRTPTPDRPVPGGLGGSGEGGPTPTPILPPTERGKLPINPEHPWKSTDPCNTGAPGDLFCNAGKSFHDLDQGTAAFADGWLSKIVVVGLIGGFGARIVYLEAKDNVKDYLREFPMNLAEWFLRRRNRNDDDNNNNQNNDNNDNNGGPDPEPATPPAPAGPAAPAAMTPVEATEDIEPEDNPTQPMPPARRRRGGPRISPEMRQDIQRVVTDTIAEAIRSAQQRPPR